MHNFKNKNNSKLKQKKTKNKQKRKTKKYLQKSSFCDCEYCCKSESSKVYDPCGIFSTNNYNQLCSETTKLLINNDSELKERINIRNDENRIEEMIDKENEEAKHEHFGRKTEENITNKVKKETIVGMVENEVKKGGDNTLFDLFDAITSENNQEDAPNETTQDNIEMKERNKTNNKNTKENEKTNGSLDLENCIEDLNNAEKDLQLLYLKKQLQNSYCQPWYNPCFNACYDNMFTMLNQSCCDPCNSCFYPCSFQSCETLCKNSCSKSRSKSKKVPECNCIDDCLCCKNKTNKKNKRKKSKNNVPFVFKSRDDLQNDNIKMKRKLSKLKNKMDCLQNCCLNCKQKKMASNLFYNKLLPIFLEGLLNTHPAVSSKEDDYVCKCRKQNVNDISSDDAEELKNIPEDEKYLKI